jgi:hypothetical protein
MPHTHQKKTYKKLPATSQAKPSQAAKQRFRSVGGGLGEGAASLPKETKPCPSLLVFFVVMIVELMN